MYIFGGTPEGVLESYLADTTEAEVERRVEDIDRLLTEDLTDENLITSYTKDLGCQCDTTASGLTVWEWLTSLRRGALQYLQQRRSS